MASRCTARSRELDMRAGMAAHVVGLQHAQRREHPAEPGVALIERIGDRQGVAVAGAVRRRDRHERWGVLVAAASASRRRRRRTRRAGRRASACGVEQPRRPLAPDGSGMPFGCWSRASPTGSAAIARKQQPRLSRRRPGHDRNRAARRKNKASAAPPRPARLSGAVRAPSCRTLRWAVSRRRSPAGSTWRRGRRPRRCPRPRRQLKPRAFSVA